MNIDIVRPNYYNKQIKILSFLKRIEADYTIYVRSEIAKKLANVADKLPEGMFLQVDSGYRDRKSQEHIWNLRYDQFRKKFPKLSEKQIHQKTVNLVFDPSTGIPPHSTGGAVDIALTDKNGEINLSAPFNKYYQEPQLKSKKISGKAQKLRVLMHDLMLNEGFAPNPIEYWHFSYGDRAWAEYYRKRILYKEIILPRCMYYSHPNRFVYRLCRYLFKLYNKFFNKLTNY